MVEWPFEVSSSFLLNKRATDNVISKTDLSSLRKIKVAYVLTPIEFGGADRVCLNFLGQVNRAEFEIVPILLIRPWERDNFFIHEMQRQQYEYHTVPVALLPRSEGRDVLRLVRCVQIIRSLITTCGFDLIHTHGYFADIVGLPVGLMEGVPTIATCHGFISTSAKLRFYYSLDRLVLACCARRVMAVSQEIQEQLKQSWVRSSKIHVITNGVNTHHDHAVLEKARIEKRTWLNVRPDECLVGYIGRLSPEKGVTTLVEALRRLVSTGRLMRGVIVGEGSERTTLERMVQSAGLTKYITFVGFQSDTDTWWPALDVFVLPSFTEGTPMALLEAMAIGVPCVASRVGGVPSIIEHEVSGILTNPGDPDGLARELDRLIQDPASRITYAEAARKRIESRFGLDRWCKSIEEQYKALTQMKGSYLKACKDA